MAKQKIKTINGKRLVVGNVNELTNNEILVSVYNGQVLLKERDDNGLIKIISTADDFSGGSDSLKEGDLIYYKCNQGVKLNLYPIKDSITQIAVGNIESHSNLNVSVKNAFIDISQIEIYSDGSMIFTEITGAGFNIMNSLAFIYKVGSDLKTAEDIIGSDTISVITKEEYDNVFNL